MGGFETTPKEDDRAVLVALVNREQPEDTVVEYLDELAFLAETMGLNVVKSFTQKMDKPDVRSFVGKGKLEEIQTYIKAEEIEVIIFDDDLSPSQLRNPFGKYSSPACHEDDEKDDHGDNDDEARHQINDG